MALCGFNLDHSEDYWVEHLNTDLHGGGKAKIIYHLYETMFFKILTLMTPMYIFVYFCHI